MSLSDQDSMADKAVQQTQQQTPTLKPPFALQPLPHSHTTLTTPSPTSSQHTNAHGNQQVVLDTIPLPPFDSLPTIVGRKNVTILGKNNIDEFLDQDLDLSRLNRIHGHLWMCGRPMRARPLHRYKMYGYEVLGTQQMDLHLLRFSNKLLIKPLPEYLLDVPFWEEHICKNQVQWENARGWLLSYVWLITSPLDLKLAHDDSLIPATITWSWWKAFVTDFLNNVEINTLHQVNKRYQFGDLRLSRINTIYRTLYFHTHFVRGYLYGYNRYVVFFERNFSWILIAFVFVGLVLSAMQVGISLDELNSNHAFMEASLVTVVLSILSVAVILGAVTITFSGIFLFNMVSAVRHAATEQRKRKEMQKQNAAGMKQV